MGIKGYTLFTPDKQKSPIGFRRSFQYNKACQPDKIQAMLTEMSNRYLQQVLDAEIKSFLTTGSGREIVKRQVEEKLKSLLGDCLDEDILYILKNEGRLVLFVNINDYFVPAADGELLTSYEDLAKLFDLYLEKSYSGVTRFVAEKRGIPNVHWRENPELVGNSNA